MNKKIIFLSIILLIIDIITKHLIDINFDLMEKKEIIPQFFSITKIYNYGASWNILSGFRVFLILISLVILIALFYYSSKFIFNTRNIIAFSLLYSGIIGNLIDRIIFGYVIDFLDFKLIGYDYPIFNFADIFIVCGVLLIIFAILKKEDINENSSK